MAIDQNVYALSISLQLESADAFKTLDDFGQAADAIEDRISKAAQNTINSLAGVANALNQNLTNAAGTTQAFAASGTKLESSLAKAAEAVKDIGNTQSDSVEDIKDRLGFLEDIEDIQEKLEKSLVSEQTTGQEYLKLIDKWTAALEAKNLVHDDEGNLVDQEYSIVQAMNESVHDLTNSWTQNGGAIRKVLDSLTAVWQLIKLFDSETENFVTANYRVYGSQQQITNQTRMLTSQYGILRKQALETYAILGNLKIPRDELDKYARTVAEANRFTGMGIQELGNYAFRMRQVGMDADGMRKQIRFAADMMRKFGLSTADVNNVLNDTGMSAMSLERIFRGKDQAAKYQRLKLTIAGLAKQIGITSQVTEAFFKNIEDPIQRELFADFAGQSINSVEDMQKAMGKASVRAAIELNAIAAAVENGSMEAVDAAITQKALAEAYGFGSVKAMEMAASLGNVAREMGFNLQNAGDFQRAMAELTRRGMDPFDESNRSLTAQLNILKAGFTAFWGVIMQFLADALWPLIAAYNKFSQELTIFLKAWFKSIGGVEKLKKIWADFLEFISPAIDVVQNIFNSLKDTTKGVIDAITDIMKEGAIDIPELLKTMGMGVLKILGNLFDSISTQIIGPMWDYIKGLDWAGMWAGFMGAVGGVWDYIKGLDWAGMWNELVKSVKGIWGRVKIGLTKLWKEVSNFDWAGMWVGFITAINGVFDSVRNIDWWLMWFELRGSIKRLWNQIQPSLTELWENIKTWARNMWGRFKDWITPILIDVGIWLVKKMWKGIVNFQPWLYKKLLQFGAWAIVKIGDGLTRLVPWLLGKMWQLAIGLPPKLIMGFFSMMGWMFGKLLGFGVWFAKAVGKGILAGVGLISDIFGGLVDSIIKVFNPAKMIKVGSDLVSNLKEGIVNKWNEVKNFFADSWKWIRDKMNPFAKASPSMVDLFASGFDEMKDMAGQFGTNTVSAWKDLRERAGAELAAMKTLVTDLTGYIKEAYTATQGLFDEGSFGGMLDRYAALIENAAIRIETAVLAKAIPAMAAASEAGLDDVVRSEAITTVQVMNHNEGDSETLNEHTRLATAQVALLNTISEKLDSLQEGGAGELTSIVELLEQYLPEMTARDEGLSVAFNQWMK